MFLPTKGLQTNVFNLLNHIYLEGSMKCNKCTDDYYKVHAFYFFPVSSSLFKERWRLVGFLR